MDRTLAYDPRRSTIIPLIVATGLLVENIDATVLVTAIPSMAVDFGINPINLKLALTSYLLTLAIFIPASGWVADRFGARNVFCAAMAVFAVGSIACAMSQTLAQIVTARVVQGIGGAMMVPVGRLVVLRSVPRHEIVGAMALIAMPALLGPVMGPPLGGFITTYFGWHWIFWINVPIALAGIVLAIVYIPQIRETASPGFDWKGFALVGPGLAAVLGAISLLGLDYDIGKVTYVLFAAGVVLLAVYVRHAFARDNALIDLRLMRIPTFQKGITGGFLFRVGVGATPFLLPLLLQTAMGMTAFESGLTTFVTGAGALTMKALAPRIISRFGFREVLFKNAFFAAIFAAAPVLFLLGVPVAVVMVFLFIGGLSRSLQFTSVNAVVYADIPQDALSRASTFSAVLQELSGSVGIAIAALTLHAAQVLAGGEALAAEHFYWAFLAIGVISVAAAIPFSKLPPDAGGSLTRRMPVTATAAQTAAEAD